MKTEILNKIKDGHFVTMKVSFYPFKENAVVFEVTNAEGVIIEELTGVKEIAGAQLYMIKKAGEYANKGMHVIINPFTN